MIPFRCPNILKVNDIFDAKNLVYDYHQHDAKILKEIRAEVAKLNLEQDVDGWPVIILREHGQCSSRCCVGSDVGKRW